MEKQEIFKKLLEINQFVEDTNFGDIVIECDHNWKDLLLLFSKATIEKSKAVSTMFSFYIDVDYFNVIQWCPVCHSLKKIERKSNRI